MNSIERVKAAIHFKKPDRVPIYRNDMRLGDVFPMPMLPSTKWRPGHAEYENGLYPFHQDDLYIKFGIWRWKNKPDWALTKEHKNWLSKAREEVDEFGAIWNLDGNNKSMGHPGRPVLTDWADLDTYLSRYTPDPFDKTRYSLFLRLAKLLARNRYRMCILGFQGPFTMASAIRGFSEFMTDFAYYPDEVKKLLNHLTDFYLNSARAWVKFGAKPHGFIIYDDLGTQDNSFISPSMFADFFEPVFKKIIDAVHDMGCELHLHSCGKIDPLIPVFLDWGLDALELDAPRMIGYEDMEKFRDKIMKWGCIDIQRLYTQASPEECQKEVRDMIKFMGTPNGGFGAYFYPQTYHIGVPKANVKAFKKGLKKYGDYSSLPDD
ncbi:MAG: hypothetical protein GY847_22590 [Proteobacteria bacterium]|nr:hypothetical protein [Pseudomonadota bacterium]